MKKTKHAKFIEFTGIEGSWYVKSGFNEDLDEDDIDDYKQIYGTDDPEFYVQLQTLAANLLHEVLGLPQPDAMFIKNDGTEFPNPNLHCLKKVENFIELSQMNSETSSLYITDNQLFLSHNNVSKPVVNLFSILIVCSLIEDTDLNEENIGFIESNDSFKVVKIDFDSSMLVDFDDETTILDLSVYSGRYRTPIPMLVER